MASFIPKKDRDLIVARYLGGDLRLCQEICAIRQLQEKMKIYNPNHPLRIYGKMVEMMKPREDAWMRTLAHASTVSDSANAAAHVRGVKDNSANANAKFQDILDAHGYYVF